STRPRGRATGCATRGDVPIQASGLAVLESVAEPISHYAEPETSDARTGVVGLLRDPHRTSGSRRPASPKRASRAGKAVSSRTPGSRKKGVQMARVYKDLREFLAALEEAGQLVRIKEEVMPEPDIGSAGRAASRIPKGPAVLFEKIA